MDADDLAISLKMGLSRLSKSERRRAIESVRDVIRAAMLDDAAGTSYEIQRCPRCGSVAIVKKGKSGNGGQRYLCRDCGRTFSGSTDRILGTSKLPRETWMAYAECFVLMLPLRELLASIYFSPFSPTYFHQSRQRGCAGFANADAPLSASRLPPPSRPHRRWIRPSGGTTVPLS